MWCADCRSKGVAPKFLSLLLVSRSPIVRFPSVTLRRRGDGTSFVLEKVHHRTRRNDFHRCRCSCRRCRGRDCQALLSCYCLGALILCYCSIKASCYCLGAATSWTTEMREGRSRPACPSPQSSVPTLDLGSYSDGPLPDRTLQLMMLYRAVVRLQSFGGCCRKNCRVLL